MLRTIFRQAVQVIPTLLGITILVFLMAGLESSPEVVERIRADLGLDQPLYIQFWRFLSGAVQGDFGTSMRTGAPVIEEIADRFPHTLRLALGATVLATVLGMLSGILAAVWHNRIWDNIIMVLLLAVSTPSYWLALMMMLLFSLYLGLLPAIGVGTAAHLVLPIVTLGAQSAGIIARMTRAAMLDVLKQDYIRTARSKGLGEWPIVLKHALRNALIPVITIVGLRFGGLLAGTVLVESVFAIPGIGRLVVDAVLVRDYPMIQGAVLFLATVVIVTNMVVDMLYGVADPRVRIG